MTLSMLELQQSFMGKKKLFLRLPLQLLIFIEIFFNYLSIMSPYSLGETFSLLTSLSIFTPT